MSNPGLGVMIQQLGCDQGREYAAAAVGKTISEISVNDESLSIKFDDQTGITILDAGQSCCESRYLTCDDDLGGFVGASFQDLEEREMADGDADGGYHDQAALLVTTSAGVFTVVTHNEHNGYYGGFYVKIFPMYDPRLAEDD